MQKNGISASLSTQNLTFRPGGTPAIFEVIVNNDSDQRANFQIEITAAGEIRNPDYRWYKLEPEVAAAKPPGSSTVFQVFVLNSPIPGLVGTVNLTVTIFSPQLGQQRRLVLRLKIEPDNQPTMLSVELPVREFQVYPRNTVDIPVRVRNLSQQTVNVTLQFAGVDVSWLVSSAERRFALDAGGQTEAVFQCQPLSVVQAPSDIYPFTIEATSISGYPASAEGNLEVLPVGFVEFSVPQNSQTIPQQGGWLPNWKADNTSFELVFRNASNLFQEINLKLQGRDWRKCTFKTLPTTANLNLGETTKLILDVQTKRHWLGIRKTLFLEAKPELSDQRLGSTDPATQNLELRVLPILPLWLQLAILLLLLALLALLFRPEPIMHTRSVKSVGFSGTSLSVVSGADDCTLRLWNINGDRLEPASINYDGLSVACERQHKPKGLLAITDDAVEVARFIPLENDRVAVGLDNGVIELRDVPTGKKRNELQDQKDPKAKGDRVFDLAFTKKDSLDLFSGYGSGKVRQWTRASINDNFQPEPKVIDLQTQQQLSGFQVRGLVLSPDDQTLVMSGNYKRFLLWQWNQPPTKNKTPNLSVQKLEKLDQRIGREDYIWGLAFVPNSAEKILATSDSAGYITIWNLDKCQNQATPQNQISELNCPILDRWSASKLSVRSLAFNETGRLLVSAGDDGRVMMWYLTPEHKLDKIKAATGEIIYQSTQKINTIAVKTINQTSAIVSGSEDSQVRLHPHKIK
ncbi:hypothetical protein H6G33_23810 [Calothrix sp. FACHB-1219]|uniref:hypothetical protein n=1 Tax=unclassified Calothrix TaxID=2619626 RepID=UPI00168310FE|nr:MULTISPECIES: hypothetical protein [unclassified Calothrix]MBD2205262.1 hypothetical protein [Calothrix sp. FACHB-168]MBD2220036.1 hypothetical protein [Calothrix sp. FACHB-1219]